MPLTPEQRQAKIAEIRGQLKSQSSKAIREQCGALGKEVRVLADLVNQPQANGEHGREFAAEEADKWETINVAYDAREAELNERKGREDALARANQIDASLRAPASGALETAAHLRIAPEPRGGDGAALTAETWATALQGWMRYDSSLDIGEEHERAAKMCGVSVRSRHFTIKLPQAYPYTPGAWVSRNGQFATPQTPQYGASLSSFSPATGSVLIPTTFVNSFESAMLAFGGPRRVAEVMRTTTGEDMIWPHGSDTSNTGRLISENPTLTTEDPSPGFGATVLHAYGYTSDIIKVPYSLLRDSAINLPQLLGSWLGERIGRATATHFTTGDGAAKPYGMVPKSSLGVTTASATAIAADELLDLVHSIDPAYRVGPGVGWAFHDNIFLALRKLKDGNGRYMWQESLSSGEPNRLLDYPYTIIQEMQSSVTTATKTMLFGALSKYKIRDVGEYRLKRLEELYAVNDMIAFVALSAHDGNLLVAQGSAPVKHMLQA